MKITPLVKIVVLSLLPYFANAGLILTEGQSFDFEFTSISSTNPFPDTVYAFATFTLGSDYIDEGEDIRFSVFHNNVAEAPFGGATLPIIMDPFHPMKGWSLATDLAEPYWTDSQGVFRLEVITGSVELESFSATTIVGGQYFSETYAVPEPSTIILLGLSSTLVFVTRRRTRN